MEKYTLIITEKPSAAERIALALDNNERPKKSVDRGVPYYVAEREKQIVVVPAVGHLYTVAEARRGKRAYPVFDYEWMPRWTVEKNAGRIRTWLEAISRLAEDADTFIDACDYDLEGSVIGYTILKHACNQKEDVAKRMKFSTLTKEDLINSYTQQLPHLDFPLIEAGLTRHEVDWLYGINLSRALTSAAKGYNGKYATLSTGRVQGPTLRFIVLREKTLKTFVPVPYWTIKAQAELNNEIFEATYEKEAIEAKKEAYDILNASRNRDGQIMKIDKRQFQQMPPTPLDIGTLQGTAYSSFGYVPKYTLDTAQRLYLEALISYPRTSSQKLPPTIDYRTILQKLSRERSYREPTMQLLSKTMLKPNEGKKDDPAHPAIYPTGDLPKRALTSSERNIWDLIVRRFMAAFGGPATMESMKVRININGHIFFLKGIHTMMEGWRRFYQPYVRSKELLLPSLQEGQQIKIERIILEAKFTKPPSRYNPGSLLKKMEAEEIGTKATRAEIMQTLQERKYIQGKTMVVTELGFEVSDVLEKHCPVVASVKFTRELEEKMSKIQEKVETKENVLHKAIATLKPVLEKLKEDEEEIGEQLGKALQEARMRERIIGPCPVCKTGQLIVVHSAKTGKRFIGCTNYFKNLCKTSSSLPQKGFLKSGGKTCSTCGWPTIKVMFVARRPWVFCPNPNCESKKRRRTD